MNCKGLKFKNSVEDFRRWCKEFPPLGHMDDVWWCKAGDVYVEVGIVPTDPSFGVKAFQHAGAWEYNAEDSDFAPVDIDDYPEARQIVAQHKAQYIY